MSSQKGRMDGLFGLTQGEAKCLLLGMLYTNSEGKVDFERVAADGFYKNAPSASSAYRQVKKKFLESNPTGGGASASPSNCSTGATENASANPPAVTPKKTPTKRKRAAAGAVDGVVAEGTNTEGEASSTPKPKRQRKSSAKKGAASNKKDNDGDEDMDAPPIKSETEQPDPNTAVKTENEDTAMGTAYNTLDEDIKGEMDVEAEFAAMEGVDSTVKMEDTDS
ncbi:putative histone h1.3 [Aspergillus lucknowensis]|uniref:Histone h1.3 n=1 Tax=Aspergillus lucknowensis TaxID=176173 RepID=A0ABR4M0G0_9EURO